MSEDFRSLATALESRYRFEREVGSGGWGVVFLAEDLKLGRQVAIKVLRVEMAAPRGRERFSREIAIASKLSHPHIVPLLDSGDEDGTLYYVMPFIAGESLQQRIRRERQLPIDEALRIAEQVAGALSHAHDAGIVHRDIKPGNIMLSGGEVRVTDFGIARALHQSLPGEWISSAGVQIGTPEYMSPEQAAGDAEIDGRSDIYSLGCVLYEMLAGAPPFTGSSPLAVMSRHSLDHVPPLRTVRPAVPALVEQAIDRALAKVPADRYSNAREFAQALEHARTHPATDVVPEASWLRRNGRRLATGGVIAVAVFLIARTLPYRAGSSERSWVLVADFDAPRGEASLGTAVRELVTAGLNQATNLSVVPQEQVTMARREASIPDTAALETALARELAFRSSVRIIVNGSVQRIGRDGYGLVLNAVDAETGENRFSSSTYTTDRGDALVSAIATLVRRLREELGERREVVEATRPLMRARTPSFAAFRSYADAISVMRAGSYDRSNILLQDAVAVDSAFATAWAAMAMNYVTARRLDSASIAFAHAAAHPDRMGDADLHRLRGDMAFNIDRDLESAVAWYHRFLAESPNSVGGHNNLGLYLSALGRHDEALAEFQSAATIDPLHKGPRQIQLMNIAAELVIVGRVDSARGVASKLRGAPAQYLELMLLNAEDRWDSLAHAATAIKDAPGTERFVRLPAQTHAVGAMAARGAIDAATADLLRLAASSTGADQRWYLHALLLLDLVLERPSAWALPAVISTDTSAGAVLLRGVRSALRGDIAAARREARVLESHKSARRSVGSGLAYLGALIEAKRAAWPAVRVLLAADAAKGEHDPFSLDRVSSLSMRWLVAQSFARGGMLDSATIMLETVARPTSIPPAHYPLRGFVVPFAHRQLAIWYSQLGRLPEATRHREAFTKALVAPDAAGSALLRVSQTSPLYNRTRP